MLLLYTTIVLVLSFGYGILSRMCGGGFSKLPYSLEEWLYAIPYGIVSLASGFYLSLVAFFLAFLSKRTATGHGKDLGWNDPTLPDNPDPKPEPLEYLILWLKPKLSPYWYGALLLSLASFLGTTPAGILVSIYVNPLLGILLILSGFSKPLGYMIGWKIYPNYTSDKSFFGLTNATEIGEFFTGFFAGIPLFSIIIYFLTSL